MLRTMDVDYIVAGFGFIQVLLMLRKSNVKLWLRLLMFLFMPVVMSVIPIVLVKWSAVRFEVIGVHVPGLRYSSFAMALGYGFGSILVPCMVIYFFYCVIELSRYVK